MLCGLCVCVKCLFSAETDRSERKFSSSVYVFLESARKVDGYVPCMCSQSHWSGSQGIGLQTLCALS